MGEIPIGKVVRELREKSNLSQRKLSIITGIDRGYINKLEAGKTHTITLTMAEKLSRGLGLAPSALLDIITTDDAGTFDALYDAPLSFGPERRGCF
jgi:transcriptional regulator with XRE-family HTH domain